VRALWLILRGADQRGRKLRGLIELLRPYRGRTALMFVALVLATAAALAPPYLAGRAIDDGIRGHDLGALYVVVVLFLLAALVNWGATYAQTYLVNWVGERALQDLRVKLFRHMQRLSVGFYARNKAGVLISRMTNDVEALNQLVTDSVVTLFQSTLTLFGTAAILVALDLKLALVTFLSFPILFVGSLAFRIASSGAYRLTREKIAWVTAYLQETLSGVRVVRAFGQEARHEERFAELNEDNREANMKTVYLNAAYFPAVELLSAVATAAILLYGGAQVVSGDSAAVTIGVLASFVFYLNSFFDPIQALSQLYTTYQAGMAALDKIFELLDEEPDIVDRADALELPRVAGEIRFEDVSFAYGSGPDAVLALRNVDLTIPPGMTVALVGATGAGKSTFVKLVARFHDPTSGRVLVDGHDLRDVTERSLRSQLGVVPQEGFLFSGTIRDNIAFGRPDASDADVEQAARAVGAHEFICGLQSGYDTEVGERGGHLSAGQRQLVAFARAAVADPRILILDEATSNVDVHTEGRIEAGLRRLLAGRTAIVIAHRLSTIQGAGRIVVLDHGEVVEQGTHAELLDADGAYARLYRDWAAYALPTGSGAARAG
jgi:ABC-type multidrug transport system fused ATPase/permease subunit